MFDGRRFGGAVAAVLGLLLLVRIAHVAIAEPRNLTRPVYILEGIVIAHPPGGAPLPAEPMPRWATALPRTDLKTGQQLSQQCAACHDLSAAMHTVIGPPLYGIIGRRRASVPSFAYSVAMQSNHDPWTLDDLFMFLRDPQLYIPHTRMSFGGIKDAQQRVDLIAYLQSVTRRARH